MTKQYFKFTIVRDPWTRFVSSFDSLNRRALRGTPLIVSREEAGPFKDVDEFSEWILSRNYQEKIMRLLHFRPQFRWFCLGTARKPRISVDHVGRFETLQQEWQEIARRLGIAENLPSHSSGPSEGPKSVHPTDRGTVELIGDMYATDAELFDYVPPR